MVHKTIFLASRSLSRQLLLNTARIPFLIIGQDADEKVTEGSVEDRVRLIAQRKLIAAHLPDPERNGDQAFVITADTMVSDKTGCFCFGKPKDRKDAQRMLLLQTENGARVVTGFCVARYIAKDNVWVQERVIDGVVGADVVFSFSERSINRYLDEFPDALTAAGALMIEGFGAQFVTEVCGSYTAILGLPLSEVREALKELAFFDC